MSVFVCVSIGMLFSISVYLLLSRNLLRWLLGIVILSSCVNLIILISGRLSIHTPPFIKQGHILPIEPLANPLPQALILTAIVIGFGLLIFALILIRQLWLSKDSVDSNQLKLAEPIYYFRKNPKR